jgi:ubiquinone/menaquinone biosynthesis C-methylase UbiE
MSRFGDDPRAFFDGVYQGAAPWDIGAAQPALVELFGEHPPGGPVLDVGCGSGDLAIHLAGAGLEVLGVDFVESAVAEARERAAAAGAASAEFRVGDALRPSLLGRRFASVVDCGFLHLFDSAQCERFAEEVASVLLPGGRYYVLAFAVEFPIANAPRRVTEEELRSWFSPARGWSFLEARPARFESRVAVVPALAACIHRMG